MPNLKNLPPEGTSNPSFQPKLPPITERDFIEQPERLRKMPRGGFAWKCELYNQAASSLTQGGLRCYQHGGTRKRAKDRLE